MRFYEWDQMILQFCGITHLCLLSMKYAFLWSINWSFPGSYLFAIHKPPFFTSSEELSSLYLTGTLVMYCVHLFEYFHMDEDTDHMAFFLYLCCFHVITIQ